MSEDPRTLVLQVRLREPHAYPRTDLHRLGEPGMHAAPGIVRVWAGEGQLAVSNPIIPGTMPDVGELDTPGVRRAQSPGLGLGLAIVRRLSERAGLTLRWEVSAESEFQVVITERGRQAG